ncbi:hypothetical protein [uncultured Jatrophihabitans sp.]|uniref:hypothetical protein n=1 Tax=uncultured Jatrophihabitans sp. TaxID=1610747 RepID=UPI0035CC7D69
MAIVERIEPAYPTWTPVGAAPSTRGRVDEDEYTGKHRKPGRRLFVFARMFYAGQHRRA